MSSTESEKHCSQLKFFSLDGLFGIVCGCCVYVVILLFLFLHHLFLLVCLKEKLRHFFYNSCHLIVLKNWNRQPKIDAERKRSTVFGFSILLWRRDLVLCSFFGLIMIHGMLLWIEMNLMSARASSSSTYLANCNRPYIHQKQPKPNQFKPNRTKPNHHFVTNYWRRDFTPMPASTDDMRYIILYRFVRRAYKFARHLLMSKMSVCMIVALMQKTSRSTTIKFHWNRFHNTSHRIDPHSNFVLFFNEPPFKIYRKSHNLPNELESAYICCCSCVFFGFVVGERGLLMFVQKLGYSRILEPYRYVAVNFFFFNFGCIRSTIRFEYITCILQPGTLSNSNLSIRFIA